MSLATSEHVMIIACCHIFHLTVDLSCDLSRLTLKWSKFVFIANRALNILYTVYPRDSNSAGSVPSQLSTCFPDYLGMRLICSNMIEV